MATNRPREHFRAVPAMGQATFSQLGIHQSSNLGWKSSCEYTRGAYVAHRGGDGTCLAETRSRVYSRGPFVARDGHQGFAAAR